MNQYVQNTGNFYASGLRLLGTGYSGNAQGKNNPLMQRVRSIGPIPCGMWTIEGPPYSDPVLGPIVMRLEPQAGTDTFTRSEFRIHADMANPALRGTASHGCIVLPPAVRQAIWDTGDRDLLVVATEADLRAAC